jgi:hypothetical protein
MKVTPDTLVSEVLEAKPDAAQIFLKYGVDLHTECPGVLDNPLDLCETMCAITDFESFMKDLKAFMADAPDNH